MELFKTINTFIICIYWISSIYQSCIAQMQENTILLDAEEVAKIALNNNFDIQIYNLDRLISEEELLKSYSVYDTEITGEYEYDENRLARATTFLGERETAVFQEINLEKELPTGTILSLGTSHEREYTDSVFATLNPYHESTAEISITQPLLKDFLGIQNRNTIKVTALDAENVAYTSVEKIEQMIALSVKAYWRLVLAYHEVGIRDQILSSAEKLYEVTKKNFELGTVEDAEVYAVGANLKEGEKDLILVKNKLNTCMNDLRLKLNLPKDIDIIPKDKPSIIEGEFDFNRSLRYALANRRDYKMAKNEVKAKNLTLAMKRDSLWPQIDLVGTFKKNGIDKKFSKSVREISSEDNPEYIIGIEFSFPLENREARAEFKQAQLEKTKMLVNLKRTECAVFIQVNDAVNYCIASKEAAEYQHQAMKLQESKYRAEEDRFRKGRSNIDRLIRYQQDYLNSQISYLNSVFAYNEALIDLKVVTAELLNKVTGRGVFPDPSS